VIRSSSIGGVNQLDQYVLYLQHSVITSNRQ